MALGSAVQYVAGVSRAPWSFVRTSALTASELGRQSLLVGRSREHRWTPAWYTPHGASHLVVMTPVLCQGRQGTAHTAWGLGKAERKCEVSKQRDQHE